MKVGRGAWRAGKEGHALFNTSGLHFLILYTYHPPIALLGLYVQQHLRSQQDDNLLVTLTALPL